MKHKSLIGLVFSLIFILTQTALAQGEIRQWASTAKGSTQFSATDWSAQQATGAPNSLTCADAATAWASATVADNERLILRYDEAVYPTQVNIFQNYGRGSIVSVAIMTEGGQEIALANSQDTDTSCPGVFSLAIPPMTERVNGVIVYVDQVAMGEWNEIDAVELVGYATAQEAKLNPATTAPTPVPANVGGERKSPAMQVTGPLGREVTCEDGGTFTNGVEVSVIQMRSGYNYTATVQGVNGFDPVLAVLDANGEGLCTDDELSVSNYTLDLPTSGFVSNSNLNSQVVFANTSASAFSDISLVVGGRDDQNGEFVLILEGMTYSSADGAGDTFSTQITQGMALSGVPVSAYVISVTNAYDPYLSLIDADYNIMTDDQGYYVVCDDSGNPDLCWGESYDLSTSYVTRSQERPLGGGVYDAMLTLPIDESQVGGYYNYLVNAAQNTYGDYLMVFHMATGPQN
ncbi:MAG: hypothetical protein ACOYLB_10530 [Phototrophicaceae bacterium]